MSKMLCRGCISEKKVGRSDWCIKKRWAGKAAPPEMRKDGQDEGGGPKHDNGLAIG